MIAERWGYQLGRLAIPRPWDASRREAFKTRMTQLLAERSDTENVDALALATSRRILAMEPVTEKNPDVQRVEVVAAYNSTSAVKKDFVIADAADPLAAQALLLARRLAIPAFRDKEKVLKCAIELSRDAEFRKKRSALFDWQEDAIKKGWSAEEAVQRIAAMSDDYNEQVKRAAGTVWWKLAFLVCGIGLGFASGITAIAAGTAALSGIQFLAFDRKPAVDAGSTGAAAMFHDVKTKLGIRLER